MLAASWDGNVRLYDDSDSLEEGSKKYTMDKHKDSVNFLDFKNKEQLCASCGDDGLIFNFNYISLLIYTQIIFPYSDPSLTRWLLVWAGVEVVLGVVQCASLLRM